jgi:hypothetical protein
MPIQLVDFEKTYELNHPAGVAFTLKHWTNGMQDAVDRACLLHDKEKNTYTYDIAKEREMKIALALVAWSGVQVEGEEVPCTPENMKKLPVGITLWIQKEIEERAGLRITEAEKKN